MRAIVLTALLAASARAQDTAATRACDQPATGNIAAAIYGQLSPIRAADTAKVDSAYMNNLLEAIRESLHPGPLALDTYITGRFGAMLAAEATVVFTVTREGKVRDLGLASSSLSPAFDRAIYHAVQIADSTSLILPMPRGAPSRVEFSLSVYLAPYPAEPRYAWLRRSGIVRPLAKTMLPRWTGPMTQASPLSHDVPRYPEIARRSNVEDSLQVRFVLDTNGRIIPASLWFVSGTYQDFARSIQDWIPQARYHPMRIGTCAVRAIEWQAFMYKLQRN